MLWVHFFFSSRRRHTRFSRDWSSDVCSSDLELVVVAEKREERLQTIPIAVSAFTSQQRQLLGIASIQDLTDFTPGLTYTTYDNRPYVRGIGRQTDNLAVESGVANYIDGIYNGSNASTILQQSSLFIDR